MTDSINILNSSFRKLQTHKQAIQVQDKVIIYHFAPACPVTGRITSENKDK